MDSIHTIIVFTLDGQRCGVALTAVERVARMVEITPLPGVPVFVRGVINVQGEIMPVVDLRLRFGLPARPVRLDDQLIITRFAGRGMALTADIVQGVCTCRQEEVTEAGDIMADLPFLSGIARLPDGLILIHDLEQLLSADQSQAILAAIAEDSHESAP
jgi:purine-binding chemotaxis protein CheW